MSSQHDESLTLSEGSVSNRVSIDMGSATIAIVISLMLIIGACGVVMGLNLSKQERQDQDLLKLTHEAKQIQIQLMYTNAILIREGVVHSGDEVYGPEGNLEYRPKVKHK